MSPSITRRGLAPLALAAAALPRFAIAQPAWRPNRPVRIIVPFPPGGATDMLARLVAQGLGNRLGQPLVVENRPGGVGVVATQNLLGAPADGHALIFATCDTHTIMPAANPRLPYNAAEFVPVTGVATTVMALIARPGLGVTNVQQFLERARTARPGLAYGSYGVATVSHAAGEMLKQASGIDMTHVPYGGAGPAILAVTADQVDCTVVPVAVGNPQRSRSVMLGVASAERFPLVPEVPTLTELGLPVVADAWIGLLAAPGTPGTVAESLHAAVAEVLATSDFAETLRSNGFSQQGYGPARFAEHLRAERARWGKVVREARITIEG
ncbi:ABC transporter substrate-binding protein [Siccirubricoccus deserti]|uniref:Tripartite tricarboxylate transporter substrate binding protein n=1 Tax=Siccirubricoccus deserti TaxID=2013562 RepID=A0A9X0R3R5_9PROT|nr:tripartite tricarboxylate transporter substrate binding protein [Siccirubricoccus deserti]MBC4017868.1 tripartite tricarboxylate transporter substrate binding protein [Siccirubricoccus deserti]GGC53429.1 ABC transporter substrate-binding protein [Siccirubricoccus deserti]